MTTYRRFCCDDLLRFGSLNLSSSGNKSRSTKFYLIHLAKWPENCHVADEPGGRIAGYILGCIERRDKVCTGLVSVIRVSYRHLIDVSKNLIKLLEDSCEKIYNAFTVRLLIYVHDTKDINACEEFGYVKYKRHQFTFEMRKPLPRLLKMVEEENRMASIEWAN